MTAPESKLMRCEGRATVTNASQHLFITAATYSGLIGGVLTLCVCVYIFVAAQDIKNKTKGEFGQENVSEGLLKKQRLISRLFLLIRRRFVSLFVRADV